MHAATENVQEGKVLQQEQDGTDKAGGNADEGVKDIDDETVQTSRIFTRRRASYVMFDYNHT